MGEVRYVEGDATRPVGTGPKILCHVCNDEGLWGSGFVLSLARRWPETRQAYLQLRDGALGLGNVQMVHVANDITVANMIAQHRTIRTNAVPISYRALETCLWTVGSLAKQQGATVHMPRIGCGLAGGEWRMIAPMVENCLAREEIDVYIYTLRGDTSWK